jgi:anti-sigma factor RsiW
MNNIEEKLWNYIDGTCTAKERAAIDVLLAENEIYRQTYLELLALNREIAAMEIDEPSMAFTYKVMENIRTEHAKQPLKARINLTIIKLIGGFFVITISALLIFILASVNWSGTVADTGNVHTYTAPAITNLTQNSLFKGFSFFYVMLVLFFIDSFLRKNNFSKQS